MAEPAPLFRPEAVAHRARSETTSHPLHISPRWVQSAYWVILATVAAALVYSVVGTVFEVASGPALVRIHGKLHVTARIAGTVASIAVSPGQHVNEGDVLVHLYDLEQVAELERTQREFELELVKVLRDPSNQSARAQLTGLRLAQERARTDLAERTVRATRRGTVSDVRIRPGMSVQPGEILVSIVERDAPCVVVAMLPGHYRPLLQRGMPLRLELEGYRYAYREVVIDAVGDEIVGPTELRRHLGPELADTLQLDGPTVLVQAHLPSHTFEARGERFRYYDGMRAEANVRVRSASLLVTLVPGLRYLLEAPHD